jgi:hypothetical protein
MLPTPTPTVATENKINFPIKKLIIKQTYLNQMEKMYMKDVTTYDSDDNVSNHNKINADLYATSTRNANTGEQSKRLYIVQKYT